MSVRWITWAWDQNCATAGEKLTLIALADHASEEGRCWPSTGRLAEKTGQAQRSIFRHLDSLEQAGLLARDRRKRDDGSWSSSLVILSPPPDTVSVPPCQDVSTPPDRMSQQEEPSLGTVKEPSALSEAFECFWATYGRVGPKKVAKEHWGKAVRSGADPDDILAGLKRWLAYWSTPGSTAMKWPQGFLSKEYWKDAPPAHTAARAAAAAPGVVQPARTDEDRERDRLINSDDWRNA
jgi:hypothetical protein